MCASLFSLAKAGVEVGVGAFSFFLSHTQPEGERERGKWRWKKCFVLFYCVPERECVKTVLTFKGQWSCNKRWNTRAHSYMYKMWCACAHKNCCVIVFFSFRWMPLFFPFLEIHNILATHSWQIIMLWIQIRTNNNLPPIICYKNIINVSFFLLLLLLLYLIEMITDIWKMGEFVWLEVLNWQ